MAANLRRIYTVVQKSDTLFKYVVIHRLTVVKKLHFLHEKRLVYIGRRKLRNNDVVR